MRPAQRCCEGVGVVPAAPRCAECGSIGRTVPLLTLQALLVPHALERLAKVDYHFCAVPTCDTVFFGEAVVFRLDEITVPVFQKRPQGGRTVCYCLGIDEDTIRTEVEGHGTSASAERIRALVRDDRCACEVRNPQGTCCLGNVAAIVNDVRSPSLGL